jgi:hypothetical protein
MNERQPPRLRRALAFLRWLFCDGMGEGWTCLLAWAVILILSLLPFRHQ